MILSNGAKVLISHRRLFPQDGPRFFLGVIDGYEAGIAKVSGHTWIRDTINGGFFKKSDLRTKIFSLLSGTLICYQLPESVELSKLRFEVIQNQVWLKDSSAFKMDLSEFESASPSKHNSK